jgi:hypothetical protein
MLRKQHAHMVFKKKYILPSIVTVCELPKEMSKNVKTKYVILITQSWDRNILINSVARGFQQWTYTAELKSEAFWHRIGKGEYETCWEIRVLEED